MTSSISSVSQWEARIAYVRFEDQPNKGKARPFLIYRVGKDYVLGLKITSKAPSGQWPTIRLENYSNLGLVKPSWLQLEPMFRVEACDIGPLIGHASQDLVDELLKKLQNLHTDKRKQ